MCLPIRGKIIELHESAGIRMAKVDFGDVTRQTSLQYLPEAETGVYVMVHVGIAISKADDAEAVQIYKYLDQLHEENLALKEEIDHALMFEDIVGSSEELSKVLHQVAKVAASYSTVLILGETGTGKELIARAIHKRSKRADRAFIGVNCAAIPPSLIASELFGYEKGAFTGATQRRLGRFESANGGTIFLDEIGDLPAEIQIALLRVLQEREIERVGSNKP